MKTIHKINTLLLACMAMFAVSCVDPVEPVITPVFPEKQEFIKNAGEAVELSFDANLAWELSLSAPTSQFWFFEGGVKLTSWSGAAGKQNVTIHITDVTSLETDYNCEVSMKMGDQTQVVATIKVVADQAYLKVYPAVWDAEANTWKYDDNGLVYASEPSSILDLKFDDDNMNFTLPAKVESNFTWSLPLSADVAWLDAVAEQKAGVNEVVFAAKPSAYPEGPATASVNVQKKGVAADAPEIALTAKIGDYRSILIMNAEAPIVFGSEGNIADEDITEYTLFAAEGVEVGFAQKMDYGYDDYVMWLDHEIELAQEQSLSGKLKEYQLKILVRANIGAQRTAELLIKTADKAESEFLSEDFTSLAEGVHSYAIEQDGAAGTMGGPLADVSGGLDALKEMTFELLPKSANKWYYDEFSAENVYRLTSAKPEASISFEGIPSTYTYEIISAHNATATKTVKERWWVKHSYDTVLSVVLDPISNNEWTENEDDIYAENQAGNNFSKDNLRYEGAYLLIKDGENVVAVIDCVYNPALVVAGSDENGDGSEGGDGSDGGDGGDGSEGGEGDGGDGGESGDGSEGSESTDDGTGYFGLKQNPIGATLKVKSVDDFGELTGVLKENLYGIKEAYELVTETEGTVKLRIPKNRNHFFVKGEGEAWFTFEETGELEWTITFKTGTGSAIIQFNDPTSEYAMPMTGLAIIKK